MILHKHAQNVNLLRASVDLLFVATAWVGVFYVRFDSGLIEAPKGTDTFFNYMKLAPVLIISYLLVFLGTGVYRRSLERRRVWEENFDLARAHAIAFLGFVTVTYFIFEHRYSRVLLALFVASLPILLPVGRSLVRKANRAYLRSHHAARQALRALVVGDGEVAKRVEALAAPGNDWNVECAGRVPGRDVKAVRGLLEKGGVSLLFVALRPDESAHLQELYESLGNTVAEIIIVPDFGMPTLIAPRVTYLSDLPAIALNSSRLDGYGRVSKRLFDILFSATFIFVFSPVFLLCAALVRLSSKGPVLYRQERMGLDGRTFQCLKFRGMFVDAESRSGPVWARKDDDRVTPIGRWLRRTSLDEIPQFFNVLRGDMSVVGPRPERPVFVQDFRHAIPGYMLRHKVKAGITGWAQVNGWRGNTSLEKRIECDLWYVQNWSLWLDLKICLLTPLKGFVHPHAY
jgi:exopolysaccharide biosynthesis polyprenyl glycosylphosphotransferase